MKTKLIQYQSKVNIKKSGVSEQNIEKSMEQPYMYRKTLINVDSAIFNVKLESPWLIYTWELNSRKMFVRPFRSNSAN